MASSRLCVEAALALVLVGGCDRCAGDGGASALVDAGGRVDASTDASLAASSSVAPAPSATASKEVLQKQLHAFFLVFRDGSDFQALRPYFAPRVDRFITLQHTTGEAIARSSKLFFRDKRDVVYTPYFDRLALRPVDGGGTFAALPVEMSWRTPVPASWGPSWDVGEDHVRADVYRRVQVDVEIVLDHRNAIVSYVESGVASPPLQVTGGCEHVCLDPLLAWAAPVHCDDDPVDEKRPAPVATLRPGTIVTDLGETVAAGWMPKGSWDLRKVRLEARVVWVLDHNPISVPNRLVGTSAGGVDCLAPARVADAGR